MPADQSQIQTAQTISVALIGNPNSGKTTLFNALTGLNQKTGNYAGVTVDKHTGFTKANHNGHTLQLSITDLPGTYSLFPKSIDEDVACKVLLGFNYAAPEVAVVVTDASNLKRHLLLATQVIDTKIPVVLALNMIDEADALGIKIDTAELERILGISVVAINSRNRQGFDILKTKIAEARISAAAFYDISRFNELSQQAGNYRQFIEQQFSHAKNKEQLQRFEEADTLYRFNVINYICAKCIQQPATITKSSSEKIDRIITHKFFGFAILLVVLFLVFQSIFFISEYPMSWIENFFSYLSGTVAGLLPAGQLSDLLVNGVLAGISGIAVFVPQIALLFFFIGLLEDSGYMARVSFIMDRLMRRFGLNGKSVIPIVSSVACAVPSVLGTRTISNVKERLITIFIIPLMSCSARLPVYTLLISIMMPDREVLGIFNLKGLALLGMYLLGFIATLITAWVLKLIVRTKEKSYFIMEMPVYRMPQWKSIGVIVVNKVKIFLTEAGKVILAISIILWFLSSHAPGNRFAEIEKEYTEIEAIRSYKPDSTDYPRLIGAAKLEASYAGII
ncbi:MAG: ferrous iron transport protein B, partial [Bacteroidia bacterium]